MIIVRLFLISILFINILKDKPDDRDIFISPLKIPLSLSANFGELRIDHFHSGIDIRTQGVTGKEVMATAPGYIYRISVSPGGFGKALYIRHSSGYSTVYGHLDRFIPEIEDYVVSRQYEEKSYMVTLWPPRDRFNFDQGDIVGYSGNSGSSSGPHLHYEIRRSDEEIPVNPLLFNLGVGDNIKPVIEKLVIYPLGHSSIVNNQKSELKINVLGGNGRYYIPSEIKISGRAGFGLAAYDIRNESNNKSSVYSIKLMIDSIELFRYSMDEFTFSESRYINSHIDYEAFMKENNFIERTFVLPNDKLSVYHDLVNRGIFSFGDDKRHLVEIVVSDVSGNTSSLSFRVQSVSSPEYKPEAALKNGYVTMPYNRNNRFVAKDVTVSLPSGTLYDTLNFEYKRIKGNGTMYSDIHQIHNIYTPVHKPYTLSIKPDRIQKGMESKMLILQLMDNDSKIPVGGTWNNGVITANPGTFGNFFAGIDTIPPAISSNGLKNGSDLSGSKEMRLRIRDNLSGIKSYEPTIDGKWALFEYDQKNDMLIYRFDPKRIAKNSIHFLSVSVSDNRDNISTYKCEFIW